MRPARDMLLQGHADMVRTETHHVPGINATVVLTISNDPAHQPSGAQDHRRETNKDKYQRTGHPVTLGKIKSARKQQSGSETRLGRHALFMEGTAQLPTAIKAIMPTHDQQSHDEPCQVSKT